MVPPQPLPVPLPHVVSAAVLPVLAAFSLVLLIFICIITFSVLTSLAIIIFIYTICQHFFSPSTPDRNWNDIESSEPRRRDPQRSVLMEVLKRAMEAIEERRGMRRRETAERMPAPVIFSGDEMAAKGSECVICLDEFKKEEMCMVFPVCSHVFHFSCIQHWFKRNLTCPICRSSIFGE